MLPNHEQLLERAQYRKRTERRRNKIWLAAVTLVGLCPAAFFFCCLYRYVYPPLIHPEWVDDVLISVVDERFVDSAGYWIGSVAAVAAVALLWTWCLTPLPPPPDAAADFYNDPTSVRRRERQRRLYERGGGDVGDEGQGGRRRPGAAGGERPRAIAAAAPSLRPSEGYEPYGDGRRAHNNSNRNSYPLPGDVFDDGADLWGMPPGAKSGGDGGSRWRPPYNANGNNRNSSGGGRSGGGAAVPAAVGGGGSPHAIRTEEALRGLLRRRAAAGAAEPPQPLSLQHTPAASPRASLFDAADGERGSGARHSLFSDNDRLFGPSGGAGGTGGGTARGGGTINVTYELPTGGGYYQTQGAGGGGSRDAPEGIDWGALGVRRPEVCAARLREWVSLRCREVIANVDATDRWMAEVGISAFDCSHSLLELIPAPSGMAAAAAGGAPAANGFNSGFGNNTSSNNIGSTGFGMGGAARPSGGGFGFPAANNTTTTTTTTGGGFGGGFGFNNNSNGMGFGSQFGGGGPGQPNAQQQQQPAGSVTREQLLLTERTQMLRAQRSAEDMRTIAKFDLRLSLEGQLEPTPDAYPLQTLLARRRYVLRRLRTFARQRNLSSFRAAAGDRDEWDERMPCDALLLLHVLRTSVEGLYPFVTGGASLPDASARGTITSPHRGSGGSGGSDDSSTRPPVLLVVGDTGEPYFYVRHRGGGGGGSGSGGRFSLFGGGGRRNGSGGGPGVYTPTQGPDSLFEALLVLVAIIDRQYGGSCGGLSGKLKLRHCGLDKILREN